MFALFFALMAILTNQYSMIETHRDFYGIYEINYVWIPWTFWILSLICFLPLLTIAITLLVHRKKLPSVLEYLLSNNEGSLAATVRTAYFQSMQRSGVRIVIGVFIVSLFMLFMGGLNLVDRWKISSRLNEAALIEKTQRTVERGIKGVKTALGFKSGQAQKTTVRKDTIPVVRFGLHTVNNDQKQYLDDCYRIAKKMKEVGATAILIDISDMHYKLRPKLARLAQLGITVFTFQDPYSYAFIAQEDTVDPKHIPMSMYSMSIEDIGTRSMLMRIKPTGNRVAWGAGNEEEYQLPDATVELLKKHYGYPDTMQARRRGNYVVLGTYQFPVTHDGWLYLPREIRVDWWYLLSPISAYRDFNSDTLHFRDSRWEEFSIENITPEIYRGKIILIDWNYLGMARERGYLLTWAYAKTLAFLLHNDVLTVVESSSIWLSLLCIGLSALIVWRLRQAVSLFLMFVLGLVVLAASIYLFSQNVLIDIFYPFLSLALSMLVLPGMKITSEEEELIDLPKAQ
ncbi:MAG: hypothetical protein V1799_03985 [bacterium]